MIIFVSGERVRTPTGATARVLGPFDSFPRQHFDLGLEDEIDVYTVMLEDGEVKQYAANVLSEA
jgi:hypothetical protein